MDLGKGMGSSVPIPSQSSFTFALKAAPSLKMPLKAVAGSSASVLSPFIVPLNPAM
jgi:hypothetical protein